LIASLPARQPFRAARPRRSAPAGSVVDLAIVDLVVGLRSENAAKSVNHVAIVAVDHVPIQRLQFEAIATFS